VFETKKEEEEEKEEEEDYYNFKFWQIVRSCLPLSDQVISMISLL